MQIADDAVQTWDVVQTLLKDGVKYADEIVSQRDGGLTSQRSSSQATSRASRLEGSSQRSVSTRLPPARCRIAWARGEAASLHVCTLPRIPPPPRPPP